MEKMTFAKVLDTLKTLLLSVVGGLIFFLFHLPLPFMLGPLAILFGFRLFNETPMEWPRSFRNIGLIIIGYILGISFTKQTLLLLIEQLPSVLFATVITIAFCLYVARFLEKKTGVTTETATLGTVPGGLSQMVVLAEEYHLADIHSVTLMQVLRMMSVIYIVPFLVSIPFLQTNETKKAATNLLLYPYHSNWNILIYVVCIILFLMIAIRFRFATPYLLAPMVASAFLSVLGFKPPELSPFIIFAAQLAIGAYLGLMLEAWQFKNSKNLAIWSFVFGLILVLFTLFIGFLLSYMHPSLSLTTAFLSTAPGGMAEMGMTAHAVGADAAVVSSYQLFRLMFILIVLPPLFRWWYRRKS